MALFLTKIRAYDTAIGTGTFAGYKFTVDDETNTLKFAKLA